MQKICVVIAAYNEAERVTATVESLVSRSYPVLVVDDGSSDETSELAKAGGAEVLRLPRNSGQGLALRAGILHSLGTGAGIIVTFDADGQHSAEDLEALLAPVRAGTVDVALGSRSLGSTENAPWAHRCRLKVAVWVSRLFTGLALTDAHNGLRAFSRKAASQIQITAPGRAHASEILFEIARLQLSFREVPVTIRYLDQSRIASWWDGVLVLGWMIRRRLSK